VAPDRSVRIAITDSGPATGAAAAARAVEPFADAGHSGLAIRLPLADRIVALHGGQLRFEALSPVGTRVEVTLPPDRVLPAA
jgi:signal transduction histidine kinase